MNTLSDSNHRRLFHGAFNAGQSARARAAVCDAADCGARDVLYVVANATARSAVIAELVRRRGAIFGVRVVTLRALPSEIERRARVFGAAINGGVLQEIAMERAVAAAIGGVDHKADKPYDDSVLPLPVTGLAAAASRTIREVEHAGGTRESLAAALAAGPPLDRGSRVLLDSWLNLERHADSRSRSNADAVRSATVLLHDRAESVLAQCELVVLEDLSLSGKLYQQLIAALVAAAQCPVIATSECAEQLPAAPAARTLSALRTMAKWDEQRCERAEDLFAGATTRLFQPGPAGALDSTTTTQPIPITLLEAAGDAGEVRLAARIVSRWLRGNAGTSPIRADDVLIIVTAGGRYRQLIAEIFAERGIPTSVTPERSAADTAIGTVLLELLELAIGRDGGTPEHALALLRSPHLDLASQTVDRLERRVITRGYLGIAEWVELATQRLGARATNRVDRLKRALKTAHEALELAATCDDMARAVRRLARELRLVGNAYFARRRLLKTGGDPDPLSATLLDDGIREDNQAWEVIQELLDDTLPALVRASAGEPGHAPGFATTWLTLFRRALDSVPPGRAIRTTNNVRVSGCSAGDGQPARVTILLGLQQRVFPRQPRQNVFLRDSVRKRLSEQGLDLTLSEDITEGERESFVRAVSTAQDALYLSWPATDAAGRPAVASFFLDDLQHAVGGAQRLKVERVGVGDVACRPEDASSRAELLASVAHGVWQRLPATPAAEAERTAAFAAWNDIRAAMAGVGPVATGRIAPRRPRFNVAGFVNAPHGTLELSASQLKSIGHCTFRHFVEKVLQPGSMDPPEYGALEKGSLIHDAMMFWVSIDGWSRGAAALPQLDAWFIDQGHKLAPSVWGRPLTQHSIGEDRERLNGFVRDELALIEIPGAAQPAYNELAFGGRARGHGDRDPASVSATYDMTVNTSLGDRIVRFTGSIDRVDTYTSGGNTFGIAIDYKTGASSKDYAKAMKEGTDLQLRLYLLAMRELWGITPVGALYIGFGDGVRRGVVSEAAVGHVDTSDSKAITVMPADVWRDFVDVDTPRLIQPMIERLVTLDITARPRGRDCGFCDLGAICRIEPFDWALPVA